MTWLWTVDGGHYRLDASPLPPWLAEAAFHGRDLDGDDGGPRPDVTLEQVHGDAVAEAWGPGNFPGCDAAVTTVPGLRLSVRTADCLPVVLADASPKLAVVHAGWRGLAAGILENALARFAAPGAVWAAAGPAIGVCCFQVGPEVAARFPAAVVQPRDPRPHVDLFAEAARRLGARGTMLRGPGPCTRCHQHLLHSYRGAGGGPGRVLTVARLAAAGGQQSP